MPLVTITQQNQAEHAALLDEFRALQKHHLNPSGVHIDMALRKGETVLLLVDEAQQVQAGAMLRMEQRSLKDGKSLPTDAGNVGFVYGLVASENNYGFMPGLQLQKAINREFAAKQGAFACIDILAADVVQRNLLLWCEGVQEAGLQAIMRPDLTKGGGSNRAIFVAAAADPAINLVPERYAGEALSGDAMRAKAHELLMEVKRHHPTRAVKARANRDTSEGRVS